MKSYCGLDPGKCGGIAILAAGKEPWACAMPETERDVYDAVRGLRAWADNETIAAIELVHARPGQGVTSMFTFGQGYGALRMALIASGIPFRTVTPQAWQKALQCQTKGDKTVSLRRAQELFPTIAWDKQTKKLSLAIADALLIAEWLRREEAGK